MLTIKDTSTFWAGVIKTTWHTECLLADKRVGLTANNAGIETWVKKVLYDCSGMVRYDCSGNGLYDYSGKVLYDRIGEFL